MFCSFDNSLRGSCYVTLVLELLIISIENTFTYFHVKEWIFAKNYWYSITGSGSWSASWKIGASENVLFHQPRNKAVPSMVGVADFVRESEQLGLICFSKIKKYASTGWTWILREKVGEEWERMGCTKKKGLSLDRLTPWFYWWALSGSNRQPTD